MSQGLGEKINNGLQKCFIWQDRDFNKLTVSGFGPAF